MTPETRQICTMAQEGTRPIEIARKLRLRPQKVYTAIKTGRKKGMDIPLFTQSGPPPGYRTGPRIPVSQSVFNGLEAAALRRGEETRIFAAQLLGQIVEDDLFDAVLDDGGCDG